MKTAPLSLAVLAALGAAGTAPAQAPGHGGPPHPPAAHRAARVGRPPYLSQPSRAAVSEKPGAGKHDANGHAGMGAENPISSPHPP